MQRLGRWGARSLGEPGEDDAFTLDCAILSMYSTFRPETALNAKITYEVYFGPMVVHAIVDNGDLKVAEGPHADADLVVHAIGNIKPLYSGDITPRQALDSGLVEVTGDPYLLERFVDFFNIPPAPLPSDGLAVR